MRVLITTCNTSWIHKIVVGVLVQCLSDNRYQTNLIMPTHTPYENGLNRICKDIVTGAQPCDYWLNIDSDNPPMNNPLDLVELDKDIIGCPTPIWHDKGQGDYPICWNAMTNVGEGYKEYPVTQGLQEVDAIGSGCMLVARRVLEKMEPPWFVRETDHWGIVQRGHDFLFCDKAREAGFSVWAHYDYLCRHFNEIDLTDVVKAIR